MAKLGISFIPALNTVAVLRNLQGKINPIRNKDAHPAFNGAIKMESFVKGLRNFEERGTLSTADVTEAEVWFGKMVDISRKVDGKLKEVVQE